MAAAVTLWIDRPRISLFLIARRYMTEAVSRIFFGSVRAADSLLSSDRATARFLSVASETRTRRCHFRSLYSSIRWSALTLFVPEGRSLQSMIVDRPLS